MPKISPQHNINYKFTQQLPPCPNEPSWFQGTTKKKDEHVIPTSYLIKTPTIQLSTSRTRPFNINLEISIVKTPLLWTQRYISKRLQ